MLFTRVFTRVITLFLIALVILSTIFYELYNMRADSGREKLSRINPTIPVVDSRHFFLLNETLSSLKIQLQQLHDNQEIASEANNQRHDSMHAEIFEPDTPIPVKAISPPVQLGSYKVLTRKTALLYTMDSIKSYESASEQGGAAGEILIRTSLEKIFRELNVLLDVKVSDQGSTQVSD